MPTTRREFIVGAATAAAIATGKASAAPAATNTVAALSAYPKPPTTRDGDMLYRTLGKTGVKVSLIGLGGFHIGQQKDPAESLKIIRTAIDRGITFMDNCWDYNEGQSEIRMGQALKDGYRDKVTLMTKLDGRTKKEAAKQLDESLKRLQVDHIDIVQHHEVLRMEDPDRIFGEGGSMEAFEEARKAGKLKFIGFTGHKDPLVHLRCLEVAAEHNFRFDTVQMPLNVMDAHFRSFAHQVLPELLKQEIGVLGMKSMGDKIILTSKTAQPIECLHYAMNLPTSVVITGIDSMTILDQAFEAARTFKPFSQEELTALLDRTKEAAAKGWYEKFKTTPMFDGTAQHPEWLG